MWALVLLPIALLAFGFPIFLLLLITAIVVLATAMQVPWGVLHQVMFGSVDKFSLLAVPFFIFAGELMAKGSMSQRIIDWVLTLLGGRRGAMPLTVVGASTVFGALSGSGPATVAAVGKLMYPNLKSRGYSDSFSGGLLAASGGIAVIVPPSIAMILYCVSAEQSVADLFLAGILPGLAIAALLAGYIFVFATQQDIRESESFEVAELWRATKRGVFALLAPIIILGGIYAGVFSPTEASGVACVYALVVSLGIYRDVSIHEVMDIAVSTATLTGQIMIIVAAAGLISWLMTVQGIPHYIRRLQMVLSNDVVQVFDLPDLDYAAAADEFQDGRR
ncbi:MAG: TRAP transporter large permease [Roseovarius sp.]